MIKIFKILVCAVVLIGCEPSDDMTENMSAAQLIPTLSASASCKAKCFDGSDWTAWRKITTDDSRKILTLLQNCRIAKFEYPDGPAPSLPPPHCVLVFDLDNEEEMQIEVLGSGLFVRFERGTTSVLLETSERRNQIVDLIERKRR